MSRRRFALLLAAVAIAWWVFDSTREPSRKPEPRRPYEEADLPSSRADGTTGTLPPARLRGVGDPAALPSVGETVRVFVTDETGTPVPRARLRVCQGAGPDRVAFDIGLIDGQAAFQAHADAGSVHLRVFDPCGEDGRRLNLRTATRRNVLGSGHGVRIALRPGREVSGRVVRDDDEPAAGLVVIAAQGPGGDLGISATTDVGGRFTLHGLPSGGLQYRLLERQGWLVIRRDRVNPDKSDVELLVTKCGDVEILVLDPYDVPLEGALVIVEPDRSYADRRGRTTEDGRFLAVDCPTAQGCRIDVDPTSCVPPHPKVSLVVPAPRPERLTVRVPPAAWIRGTVRGPNRTPLASVRVEAKAAKAGRIHRAETDEDGSFVLGPLESGAYDLGVPSPPGGWLPPPTVRVTTPQATAELVCRRPATIRGRVVAARHDLAYVVWLGEAGDRDLAHLAPDGTFALESVPAGACALEILDDDGRCRAFLGGLHSGRSPFDIDLTHWQGIKGRIVDERPEPREPLRLEIRLVHRGRRLSVEEDGSFETPYLSPGAYELTASDRQGRFSPLTASTGDEDVILTVRRE